MNKVHDTIVGASGIGSIELIQHSQLAELSAGTGNLGVIVQGIIGVVTLVKLLLPEVKKLALLFKKKRI